MQRMCWAVKKVQAASRRKETWSKKSQWKFFLQRWLFLIVWFHSCTTYMIHHSTFNKVTEFSAKAFIGGCCWLISVCSSAEEECAHAHVRHVVSWTPGALTSSECISTNFLPEDFHRWSRSLLQDYNLHFWFSSIHSKLAAIYPTSSSQEQQAPDTEHRPFPTAQDLPLHQPLTRHTYSLRMIWHM